MNGFFLLNKPCGVTSFEALYPIKRLLGTKKAGHAGTLDKFASGLLIVLTGKALKKQNDFMHLDKRYEAEIFFGEETDTLDPEGEVIERAPPPEADAIKRALLQFRGNIIQTPPVYSAIHVNGKRASALAREGAPPVMKPREVTIYALDLLYYENPIAKIAVHCSSGTYIRALARDIARAAGSRAYVKSLVRTAIGAYRLEDALPLKGLTSVDMLRFL